MPKVENLWYKITKGARSYIHVVGTVCWYPNHNVKDFTEKLDNTLSLLQYICHVTFSILKRKNLSTQYGNLIGREKNNRKCQGYTNKGHPCYFNVNGEGSISSLPKSLFKTDRPVKPHLAPKLVCVLSLQLLPFFI